MSSSVLLRRWTAAQIFRSGAVSNPSYSPFIGNPLAAANRMITTTVGGVSSTKSAAVPWLMMKPCSGMYTSTIVWRFYCFAKKKVFSFIPKECSFYHNPQIHTHTVELVGSSRGWLASYNKEDRYLFLLDPISNKKLKLPPLIETMRGEAIHSVALSESDETEGGGKAIVTFGSRRSLALCSLGGGSHGWTLFGGGDYDSVVYSSRHRRLFCITSSLKLEAWDVGGGETPIPTFDNDWTTRFDSAAEAAQAHETSGLNYVVCEEQSGELYLVVRHVRPEGSYWVERGLEKECVGPTVDFEVYKMDREGGRLMEMKDSLEGLTMFVGINDAIAFKAKDDVKPDSIYYGYDSRLKLNDSYYDYGVFDYRKGALCRRWNSYQAENYGLAMPVWFTPRSFRRI